MKEETIILLAVVATAVVGFVLYMKQRSATSSATAALNNQVSYDNWLPPSAINEHALPI